MHEDDGVVTDAAEEGPKTGSLSGNSSLPVKPLTLGQAQRKFTLMIARLIAFAYKEGYELTFGDAYRDPRVFGEINVKKGYGRARSNHKLRLAVDFNLFINGKYMSNTADHIVLGEYWKSLGGSWGGMYDDGNHYSLEFRGSM